MTKEIVELSPQLVQKVRGPGSHRHDGGHLDGAFAVVGPVVHMRVSRGGGVRGGMATGRLVGMGLAHQMLGDEFFADFCVAGTIELFYDGISLGRRKVFVDEPLLEFEVP